MAAVAADAAWGKPVRGMLGGDVGWSSRVLSVLVSPGCVCCVAQLSGQFVAGNIIFIAFSFGAFIIFQQVPKINFIFIQ